MRKSIAIRKGQLREFNGATVRVIKRTNNDMWLVGTHGQLWGFAKDEDLYPVSMRKREPTKAHRLCSKEF